MCGIFIISSQFLPKYKIDMDGEFGELAIVNERSEIIGVVTNKGIVEKSSSCLEGNDRDMQGITCSESNDAHFILNENTSNFFVPPPEVPESSSESGNDEDYYEIDNEIDEIQMDDIQLEILLTNYCNDVEHVDDFGNDWEWLETDPGASSGPFTGQHKEFSIFSLMTLCGHLFPNK